MSQEAMAAAFETMLFNSRVIFACGFSIIVWEQFISFREEYDVVWRTGVSWSLAKVVFVMNRYCAIAGLVIYIIWFTKLPSETCTHAHFLPTVLCLISMTAGDVILGLRVFALWSKNVFVGLGLASILAGQAAFSIWITHKNQGMSMPGGPCMSLTGESLQRFEYLTSVLCLIFEVVALFLVLVRVYEHRKAGASGGLIDRILKDSVQYFVMVFGAKLLSGLNFIFNKKSPAIFMPLTIAIASIMCSRVFFGLIRQSQASSHLASSASWRRSVYASTNKNTVESGSGRHHSVQLTNLEHDNELELGETKPGAERSETRNTFDFSKERTDLEV